MVNTGSAIPLADANETADENGDNGIVDAPLGRHGSPWVAVGDAGREWDPGGDKSVYICRFRSNGGGLLQIILPTDRTVQSKPPCLLPLQNRRERTVVHPERRNGHNAMVQVLSVEGGVDIEIKVMNGMTVLTRRPRLRCTW